MLVGVDVSVGVFVGVLVNVGVAVGVGVGVCVTVAVGVGVGVTKVPQSAEVSAVISMPAVKEPLGAKSDMSSAVSSSSPYRKPMPIGCEHEVWI